MKLSYQTNTWGGVVGHPVGVTSIKDLFYLTHGSTREAVRDIREAGYDGFEVFDGNLLEFENAKREFAEITDAGRTKLVAVYSGANFIFPDIWPEERWRLEKAAALGAEFGAEHFVVGGGAKRANGVEEADYLRVAEGLEEVVEIARKHGLTPSYHPHLGTISESPEQLAKIFNATRIGFCPDTAHLAAGGGDPAELIRRYHDRVPYVHLKDLREEPFGFLPLGEGVLNFDRIMAALNDINYDGWITVELDEYPGSKRKAAEISRKFLSKY